MSLHIVWPHCNAINGVPPERLGEAPACGKCHQPLFTGKPVAMDAARFDSLNRESDCRRSIRRKTKFWERDGSDRYRTMVTVSYPLMART